jgi:hypothetical protein
MRLYDEDEVNRRGFRHGTQTTWHRIRCWTMADLTCKLTFGFQGRERTTKPTLASAPHHHQVNHFILQLLYLPAMQPMLADLLRP